jgi:hypothetical protein
MRTVWLASCTCFQNQSRGSDKLFWPFHFHSVAPWKSLNYTLWSRAGPPYALKVNCMMLPFLFNLLHFHTPSTPQCPLHHQTSVSLHQGHVDGLATITVPCTKFLISEWMNEWMS